MKTIEFGHNKIESINIESMDIIDQYLQFKNNRYETDSEKINGKVCDAEIFALQLLDFWSKDMHANTGSTLYVPAVSSSGQDFYKQTIGCLEKHLMYIEIIKAGLAEIDNVDNLEYDIEEVNWENNESYLDYKVGGENYNNLIVNIDGNRLKTRFARQFSFDSANSIAGIYYSRQQNEG